jgi:hypothetical protein
VRTLRRIAALLALSVTGIALLAPLAAGSAVEAGIVAHDRLLAAPAVADVATPRGLLTSRTIGAAQVGSSRAPEVIRERPLPAPASVRMEATIVSLAEPAPAPPGPAAPAPAAPAPTYSGTSVWDDLAECESGGNWSINTGNGYHGGLQFSYGTWHDSGGGQYADYPHQATREEQIAVAERLRAARGYAPWPACRAKLGLP